MRRLKVARPVVEMPGDEMARVMWDMIRKRIILPSLEIELKVFDLSLENRERSGDAVTAAAAEAVRRYGVGVKCATITPNAARMREFKLTRMWPSPNATLRRMIGGTLFRAPILCERLPRVVPGWSAPIVIARHAFGDQYDACEMTFAQGGKLELIFTPEGGKPQRAMVAEVGGGGVALSMYNLDSSITDFARACFRYALERSLPVYLSTKDTILRDYDGRFRDIFGDIFASEFESSFGKAGLFYRHRLIDDMAAFVLRSGGGFLWACKNYDGDVQSDAVAQGFGSLGLMTSELISGDGGAAVTEAAHGTVTAHYRAYQAGRPTSTNPLASLFAWSRALAHRARFDGTAELADFAGVLESACLAAVNGGVMTKDLALLVGPEQGWVTTGGFLDEVARRLSL